MKCVFLLHLWKRQKHLHSTLDTRSLHQGTYFGVLFLGGDQKLPEVSVGNLAAAPTQEWPNPPTGSSVPAAMFLFAAKSLMLSRALPIKFCFSFTVYRWTDNIWLWNDPVIVTAASPAWVTGVNVNMTLAACPTRMKCDLAQRSI